MVIVTILGLVGAVLFFPVVASHDRPPALACLSNIKLLTTATRIYLADSNDVFPPQVDPRLALRSYIRNLDIGQCPTTGIPYGYNARLRGLPLSQVRKPISTVIFYEGRNEALIPAPDHTPNVAFADGHAKTVTAGSTVQFAP